MKKIFSGALFMAVIYFTMGYYIHFLIKQHTHKNNYYNTVSATLPFEGMIDFSIPIPFYGNVNTEFEPKAGEFYYKNQYYSMVGSKIVDNTMVITCVANPKLKKLNDELLSFIDEYILDQNGNNSNEKGQKSLKYFSPEFASFGHKTTLYLYDWMIPTINCISKNSILPNIWLNFNSPPPDLV